MDQPTGLELFSPSFDGYDLALATLQSDEAQQIIDDLTFTFSGV